MRAPGPKLWTVAAAALLTCAGCGFKGPLYLPERNATVVTHPAPEAQTAPSPSATPAAATKKKGESPPTSQVPASPAPPAQ